MSAAYKDATFADALVKAGARLEDLEGGRTALWDAACDRQLACSDGPGRSWSEFSGVGGYAASDCARRNVSPKRADVALFSIVEMTDRY